MPDGLTLAIALLAEVAAAAPAEAPAQPVERCGPAPATTEPGEIFVCAPRPQGYRIDPDLLEVERAKQALRRGGPKRPERLADKSCASVGPMGCAGMGGAGIDLLGAAMVLGTMATKAVRGEDVGSMFVTDPQPTEYQLYQAAKREREAKEAAAKAAAIGKAARQPAEAEAQPEP